VEETKILVSSSARNEIRNDSRGNKYQSLREDKLRITLSRLSVVGVEICIVHRAPRNSTSSPDRSEGAEVVLTAFKFYLEHVVLEKTQTIMQIAVLFAKEYG
jgi:hypothetical protein